MFAYVYSGPMIDPDHPLFTFNCIRLNGFIGRYLLGISLDDKLNLGERGCLHSYCYGLMLPKR